MKKTELNLTKASSATPRVNPLHIITYRLWHFDNYEKNNNILAGPYISDIGIFFLFFFSKKKKLSDIHFGPSSMTFNNNSVKLQDV